MIKKIIDKIKNVLLENKRKERIILLFFLIIIAIAIFSFSSLGKNVLTFISKNINPNHDQENSITSSVVSEKFTSDNITKKPTDLIIGIMSDSHAEGQIYSMIANFAKEVQIQEKGEKNEEKPDFIIELGDFIQNRNRGRGANLTQQPQAEGIAEWKKADASLLNFTPRYHVIGNHEMFSLYKKDYENLIGLGSYYSFMAKNYQIIVLDANYWVNTGENVERGRGKPGAYAGFIPQEEKKWLEEELQKSDRNIIFVHHPLYNLLNSIEIEELLTKYNEKIVLIASGHKHRAQSLIFAGIDYIDMPSLNLQKQYAIIKIKDKKSITSFINLP